MQRKVLPLFTGLFVQSNAYQQGEPECILKYNLSFRKVRLLISILFFYKEKITVADAEYKIKHPNERS